MDEANEFSIVLGGGGVRRIYYLAVIHLAVIRIITQVSYFKANDWRWVTAIGYSYLMFYVYLYIHTHINKCYTVCIF